MENKSIEINSKIFKLILKIKLYKTLHVKVIL